MASRQSGDDLDDEEQGGGSLLPGRRQHSIGLPIDEMEGEQETGGGREEDGRHAHAPVRSVIPSRLFSQSSHSYPQGPYPSSRARSSSPPIDGHTPRRPPSPSPSLPSGPHVPHGDVPSRPGMPRSESYDPPGASAGAVSPMLVSPQPMRKSPSMSSFLSPPPAPQHHHHHHHPPGMPVPPPIVTGLHPRHVRYSESPVRGTQHSPQPSLRSPSPLLHHEGGRPPIYPHHHPHSHSHNSLHNSNYATQHHFGSPHSRLPQRHHPHHHHPHHHHHHHHSPLGPSKLGQSSPRDSADPLPPPPPYPYRPHEEPNGSGYDMDGQAMTPSLSASSINSTYGLLQHDHTHTPTHTHTQTHTPHHHPSSPARPPNPDQEREKESEEPPPYEPESFFYSLAGSSQLTALRTLEAQHKMGRVDSFASLVELTDYHHCDMCVPTHHGSGSGSGPHRPPLTPHHNPHALSPHATLNSMPNSLRTIMKVSSTDFVGADYVPERNEDHKHDLRALWEWACSHGRTCLLLILMGMGMSLFSHVMSAAIDAISLLRAHLLVLCAGGGAMARLGVFVAFTVTGAVAAVWASNGLDPTMDAAGSGLPLLKYILSGDMGEEADTHLQARTLLAKVLGLTLAAGAGLSVGREGPNVHIASILSWLLLKHARLFRGLYRFPSLRRHILDAACAVGVSSTFAAPIGGVLFSIEATTNYYEISNYWKCFMAAVAGFGMTRLLLALQGLAAFPLDMSGTLDSKVVIMYSPSLVPLYILTGLLMGLLGPAYTRLKVLAGTHFQVYNHHPTHRLYLAAVVALVSALLFFLPGNYTRLPLLKSASQLLSPQGLITSGAASSVPEALVLLVYVIVRFVTSVLDTSLMLPSGDFMCLFAIGAALGRLLGLAFAYCLPTSSGVEILPSTLALCGAAALAGAATQTISTAVIAMEMTGAYHHQLAVFMSVLAAYCISRSLSVSIYDAMTRGRYMRYLPSVRSDMHYKLRAEDVMEKELVVIPLAMTYGRLLSTLKEKRFQAYPVITPDQEFLGMVKRRTLLRHLVRTFKSKGLVAELEQLMPHDVSLLNKDPATRHQRSQNPTPIAITSAMTVLANGSGPQVNVKEKEKDKASTSSWGRGSPAMSLLLKHRHPFPSSPHKDKDKDKHKASPSSSKARFNSTSSTGPGLPNAWQVTRSEAEQQLALQELLESGLDLRQCSDVTVDPSPFRVPELCPLDELYALFDLLRCNRVFVVSYGVLVGVISRRILIDKIRTLQA